MKAIIILNTNSYILAEFINKQVSQLFDTELFFIDENLDKTVDEMIKYLNKLIL